MHGMPRIWQEREALREAVEIREMLDDARARLRGWKDTYDLARATGDRSVMKEAARNFKALQGVEKTLRWVLGLEGVAHPLD